MVNSRRLIQQGGGYSTRWLGYSKSVDQLHLLFLFCGEFWREVINWRNFFFFSVRSSNHSTRGFHLRTFVQAVNYFLSTFLHARRNPISRYEIFTPQNKYLTIGFEEKSKDFKNKKRLKQKLTQQLNRTCLLRDGFLVSETWKEKQKKISLRQREESETWCAVLGAFSLPQKRKKTAA